MTERVIDLLRRWAGARPSTESRGPEERRVSDVIEDEYVDDAGASLGQPQDAQDQPEAGGEGPGRALS